MSIDYDRLRELADKTSPGPWEVEEFEEQYVGCPGVTKFHLGSEDMQNIAVGEATDRHYDQAENNFALITLAPDMARELLRLRDVITENRDRAVSELDRIGPELQAARITLYAEREHFIDFCNHLLGGDQE